MSKLMDTVRSQLPPGWNRKKGATNMELIELHPEDSEFKMIESKMGEYIPTRVVRVENLFMWGNYQLKKEECIARWDQTKETEMWHVTNPKHVHSIASNNFDWRRSKRCKFGKGVCFSPKLDHALRYSTEDGAVILAKVLVGKEHPGKYNTKVPSEHCDSTTGWKRRVYVKYMDHEFYPAYVAYLN